jgi:hypothetical protein
MGFATINTPQARAAATTDARCAPYAASRIKDGGHLSSKN